jgi:hypothetical protein
VTGLRVKPSEIKGVIEAFGGKEPAKIADMGNRLESLAALASRQKYGQVMSYGQLAEVDPSLADELRQQAMVTEPIKEKEQAAELVTHATREALRAEKELEPLDEKARFWLDRNGNTAPPALTRGEAKASGYVPVTEGDVNAVQNAKSALIQVGEYRELADRLLVRQTGQRLQDLLKVQGNRALIAFLRQSGDPDALRLEGMFGAIAVMARATGDTANIAVQERQFLKNFAITEKDSFESAVAKLDQAERIMRGVIASRNVPIPPASRKQAQPRREQPDILDRTKPK